MKESNSNQTKFPCTIYGLCCKYISNILELIEFDNGYDTCTCLVNNLCSIYDHRPQICQVDMMFEKLFTYMDKSTFYLENLKICKTIQNKHR